MLSPVPPAFYRCLLRCCLLLRQHNASTCKVVRLADGEFAEFAA